MAIENDGRPSGLLGVVVPLPEGVFGPVALALFIAGVEDDDVEVTLSDSLLSSSLPDVIVSIGGDTKSVLDPK